MTTLLLFVSKQSVPMPKTRQDPLPPFYLFNEFRHVLRLANRDKHPNNCFVCAAWKFG